MATPTFIDIELAIGKLVMAGVNVDVYRWQTDGGQKRLALLDGDKTDGTLLCGAPSKDEIIAIAYRDGSTYRVKLDSILTRIGS